MSGDEIDIGSYIKMLFRHKSLFFMILGGVLILAIIYLALAPKVYESNSIVQLASFGSGTSILQVFGPVEAKSIIESSDILDEALKFYNSYDEITLEHFKKDHLEVSLIKERVGRDEEVAQFLQIVVKSSSPEISQETAQIILDSFFNYVKPYYNRTLNVYLEDLDFTKNMVSDLEGDIVQTQKRANVYSDSSFSSGSDVLILTNTLASYRLQHTQAQDHYIKILTALASKKEFKTVSAPSLPQDSSSPKALLIIILALIVGLILAFSVVLLYDELR